MSKKYYCTLSDIKYINQGLALYESLVKHSESRFDLFYLCLDREIYETLTCLNFRYLHPILAEDHKALRNINNLKMQGYAWELGAKFTKELLNDEGLKLSHIMYIDSDICTYKGFEKVFDEIGDKSIGILPHLHLPPAFNEDSYGYPGGYNVGIIYFKDSVIGKECLDFWTHAVMNPYDETVLKTPNGVEFNIKTHNTCGDQRFLEMFPERYQDECHIIGQEINHGAPWCYQIYNFYNFSFENKITKINMNTDRAWINKIIDDPEKEKLLTFSHFAGFKPDYEKDTYDATRERFNEEFLNNQSCRAIYDEYYRFMKMVKEKYNL